MTVKANQGAFLLRRQMVDRKAALGGIGRLCRLVGASTKVFVVELGLEGSANEVFRRKLKR